MIQVTRLLSITWDGKSILCDWRRWITTHGHPLYTVAVDAILAMLDDIVTRVHRIGAGVWWLLRTA